MQPTGSFNTLNSSPFNLNPSSLPAWFPELPSEPTGKHSSGSALQKAGQDFNQDNQTDLLWRNYSTGEVGTWLMYGAHVSWVSMGTVADLNWRIEVTGDFNQDGAGNSRSTARNLGVLNSSRFFQDYVGVLDNHDYYRFSLSQVSDFSLLLNGLSANADLLLLDHNGVIIQGSHSPSTWPDSINRRLNTLIVGCCTSLFGLKSTDYISDQRVPTIDPRLRNWQAIRRPVNYL
ncbi:MAG: hypothetical protein VKJ24_07015 [Synechococcales bacterium]|nr:hypothetical protein [Synechococcales bacterium]